MEEKKDGYNLYKVIFDNIKGICKELGEPKEVIAGPLEGITEETCEEDCEHYILGNGLHVYIRDEYIYISENDVKYWGDERERKGEELGQFYLSYNKESIECICHANNGRPYKLVQYFNHELDEIVVQGEEETYVRMGKDNAFIPHSFENWNTIASGYVPEDIGALHMGENIQQDVRAVCNRIIALDKKIKGYARGPYLQELLNSEETLSELKKALQELEEGLEKIDHNEIEGKARELKEKRCQIEYLERKIQKIRDKINQMLNGIEVTDDIEPNSTSKRGE